MRGAFRTSIGRSIAILATAISLTVAPVLIDTAAAAAPHRPAGTDDHPDVGERQADVQDVVTPEEIAARRAEIAEQLAQAGSAGEFARRVEADFAATIASLDAKLAERQAAMGAAAKAAAEAESELIDARSAETVAREQVREADRRVREAAVDMFINPPQGDGVRAALTGTVQDEFTSSGLLAGRAAGRSQLLRQSERARQAARRASDGAESARTAARSAQAAAKAAADAVTSELQTRNHDLAEIRARIALLDAEVGTLQLADSALAIRLLVEALAETGSAVALPGPDGGWIPLVSGLPTAADMRPVFGTSLRVHNLIVDSVTKMVLQAAADGVVLDGSSYRDTSRQIELRMSHCGGSFDAVFNAPSSSCSPPTARPGMSMHERGLAIDFTEGGSTLTRSSSGFMWLSAHAAEYGLFNLPSEPWHWSVNGR